MMGQHHQYIYECVARVIINQRQRFFYRMMGQGRQGSAVIRLAKRYPELVDYFTKELAAADYYLVKYSPSFEEYQTALNIEVNALNQKIINKYSHE